MTSVDPVEAVIASALDRAGIAWVGEDHPANFAKLDFYLPDLGIFIECKRLPSDRSAAQLARAENVVLVQGMIAAQAMARWIEHGTGE